MTTGFDWSKYAVGGAASRPDSFTGLNPDYASRVAQLIVAAEQELGPRALTITSAYRSPELQAQLFAGAVKKYGSEKAARKWVAPPGKSKHNVGLAVDFADASGKMLRDPNSREAKWIKANAPRFGLDVPMSWEPWQVELAGARGGKPASGILQNVGNVVSTKGGEGQAKMMGGSGADTMQPERKNLLFPNMDPGLRDRLIIGLEGLTMNPNEAAVSAAQARMQGRVDQGKANATAEWLRANGSADLAEALGTGVVDPAAVVQAHMQRQEQQQAAAASAQTRQQAAAMLAPNRPDLAEAVAAGVIDPAKAFELSQKGEDLPASVQEYKFAQSQGYQGSFEDFKTAPARAGATQVTTNVGEGDTFYKELDKGSAQTFSTLLDQGVQAQQSLPRIERLGTLLESVPTGASAAMKRAAGEYGISTEGLSEIQAAEALIQQLVPLQRPPGSGPMSDKDIEMFRASLPRLINTPEGNRKIVQTMRAMAEYQVEQGKIAAAVADRQMTPEQGRRALMSLPNPLADFAATNAPPPASGARELVFNPATGRLE